MKKVTLHMDDLLYDMLERMAHGQRKTTEKSITDLLDFMMTQATLEDRGILLEKDQAEYDLGRRAPVEVTLQLDKMVYDLYAMQGGHKKATPEETMELLLINNYCIISRHCLTELEELKKRIKERGR